MFVEFEVFSFYKDEIYLFLKETIIVELVHKEVSTRIHANIKQTHQFLKEKLPQMKSFRDCFIKISRYIDKMK